MTQQSSAIGAARSNECNAARVALLAAVIDNLYNGTADKYDAKLLLAAEMFDGPNDGPEELHGYTRIMLIDDYEHETNKDAKDNRGRLTDEFWDWVDAPVYPIA